VSNIIPNDPVDLLAEYLYQKSYDFWIGVCIIIIIITCYLLKILDELLFNKLRKININK
jgi:hypothetical protein